MKLEVFTGNFIIFTDSFHSDRTQPLLFR